MNSIKVSNTRERLQYLIDCRGIKQKDIINMAISIGETCDVKFNKSDISQYLSGRSEPNQKKLYVLSQSLKVDVAWLMGYDVPMDKTETITTLTDEEKRLLENFRDLNEEGRHMVSSQANALSVSGLYKKHDEPELDEEKPPSAV